MFDCLIQLKPFLYFQAPELKMYKELYKATPQVVQRCTLYGNAMHIGNTILLHTATAPQAQ